MTRPRIVVVGAGILGSMHAWRAARAGNEVVWLDRHDMPEGASVRNFGLCWISGRAPGAELTLARRSRELWEAIGREVPGVGFRANGSVTVARSDDEHAVLQSVAARPDAEERGFSLLTMSEVRDVNPGLRGRVVGALHSSLDAAVEPRDTLGAIRARLLVEDLVTYHPRRTVVDVGPHHVVDHTGDRHEGDLVVLCVGAVTDGPLSGLIPDDDLQVVRLHMAETAPLGRPLTTSVADGNSLRYYPAYQPMAAQILGPQDPELARYGIQLLCQQRLHGGLTIGDTHEYGEPFPFDMADRPLDLVVELARAVVGEPFPAIERRWTGQYHQLRRVTEDRLYVREEVAPGVVAVTGAGGRGMTLAPAIAEETFR